MRTANVFFKEWNFYLQALKKLDVNSLPTSSLQAQDFLGRELYCEAICIYQWNCQKWIYV